jgi:hypothetical protein
VDDKKQLTRYNHLDETETGKVAVAHDILQLQAEYGYDANANGAIDEEAEWTASLSPGATRWEQILAVRIAVLMRIPHYEKDKVTNSAPRWANGTKQFSMGEGMNGCTTATGYTKALSRCATRYGVSSYESRAFTHTSPQAPRRPRNAASSFWSHWSCCW